MKYFNSLKYGLLATALFTLASCKVAVIVVEGGEVQSEASGTCMAGSVCIHQVNDTNYSESFTAVADPDWEFVKWNQADGSLCGKVTQPTCALTTTYFKGNAGVEAVIASEAIYYIMPVFQLKKILQITFESIVTDSFDEVPEGIAVGDTVTFTTTIPISDATNSGSNSCGSDAIGCDTQIWQIPQTAFTLAYESGYVLEGTLESIVVSNNGSNGSDTIRFLGYNPDVEFSATVLDGLWFSALVPPDLGSALANIEQAGFDLTQTDNFETWGASHSALTVTIAR